MAAARDERPTYSTEDLERYIEGLVIDEQMQYAQQRCAEVQRTEEEDILLCEDDDVRFDARMAGRSTYRAIVNWNDERLREPAEEALAAYRRAQTAERLCEAYRIIVAAWGQNIDMTSTFERLKIDGGDVWRADDLDIAIERMFAAGEALVRHVDAVDEAVEAWYGAWATGVSMESLRELMREDPDEQ